MSNQELKIDAAPELDDAVLNDVTGGCGTWPPQSGTAWQGYFDTPPTFPPPGWVEC